MLGMTTNSSVIPAKAGIQSHKLCVRDSWVPAFAGTTRGA